MTREQIEKAWDEHTLCNPSMMDELPLNERQAFVEGAQWRINSVWHSTDELPKYSGFLAVLMGNGIMETMYYSEGIGFHEKTLKGYTSWAYVSDLIPERKEESK